MTAVSEFDALVEAEAARLMEEIAWQGRLDINELLWGSAYGPWPPPVEKVGLRALL